MSPRFFRYLVSDSLAVAFLIPTHWHIKGAFSRIARHDSLPVNGLYAAILGRLVLMRDSG